MKADVKICKPWRGTVKLTAFSLLLAAGLAGGANAAMYRWVDSSGRVHYGDTLPSTYQQSGASEMNKQGRVVKKTQSEAERQAEAAREQAEAGQRRAASDQARYDRALLSSYASEAEIDLARDRALDQRRLVIEGTETRAREVGRTIAELAARKKSLEQAGRQPAPALLGQLRQSTLELADLKRAILAQEEAMRQVREKFAQDKARYRQLSGTVQ